MRPVLERVDAARTRARPGTVFAWPWLIAAAIGTAAVWGVLALRVLDWRRCPTSP